MVYTFTVYNYNIYLRAYLLKIHKYLLILNHEFRFICVYRFIRMARMTQELGKVTDVNGKLDLEKYPIGKMLFIYPWHVSIQIVRKNEICMI